MSNIVPPSGMSHVGICVSNMDRSLGFYRDLVGMQVIKDEFQDAGAGGLPHLYRDRHARRRVVYLQYGTGAPILVLTAHPGDPVSGEPILMDQVGISHLSFSVPDVGALIQRLIADSRVFSIIGSLWEISGGPTSTMIKTYQQTNQDLDEVVREINAINELVNKLELILEKAGAPYTPGRMPEIRRS